MHHKDNGPGELENRLRKLALSDQYPCHMPGHKRSTGIVNGALTVSIPRIGELYPLDITEIDGFDDLHCTDHEQTTGILSRIEERIAALYGADESYMLINGSTAGVLAAVSAALPEGGVLMTGRESHRSLYHAAYLRKLRLYYIWEAEISEYHIRAAVSPEDVEAMFRAVEEGGFPAVQAVFITSPTYEGICADVRKIADIAHANGVPLIVDQAHGAHFGMDERLPENAVSQGADLVIMSLHKTLPAMTQTAILHVQGDLIDRSMLRRFLRIYQSSSPSYILMASIDDCITRMERDAEQWAHRVLELRRLIEEGCTELEHLYVPSWSERMDPCKLLVISKDTRISGYDIYEYMRLEHRIQPEMAGESCVVLILTGSDTREGADRIVYAIRDADVGLPDGKRRTSGSGTGDQPDSQDHEVEDKDDRAAENMDETVTERTPSGIETRLKGLFLAAETWIRVAVDEALPDGTLKGWDAEAEEVRLSEAEGRISAEFISVYPPGTPVVVPGEVITEEMKDRILRALSSGLNVQRM